MALTVDQQFQMDLEAARNANQLAQQAKQAKLEAIRMAKETLIENARNKPVDARDVTAADITAFAQVLITYVDA